MDFNHLARLCPALGCTGVAQRFEQFHSFERAFRHIFDVLAFRGAPNIFPPFLYNEVPRHDDVAAGLGATPSR